MKNLIKILSLSILFVFLAMIPGCGCADQSDQTPQKQEEKIGNELDPNFKGPTAPPFSNGPTEPPPSL